MKNLVIYDVDDTLFFANQLIGMELDGVFDWHTQDIYHLHDIADTLPHVVDFSKLLDSADWYSRLKPNPTVIELAVDDIADQDTEVVIMTARNLMSDVEMFKQGFHDHGMDVTHIEFIFAGEGTSKSISSHLKKKAHFDRMFAGQYDTITVYDDNDKNLQTAMESSWDFPFTSFRLFKVNLDGTINTFLG